MDSLNFYGIKTGEGKYYEEIFYGTVAMYNVLEREIAPYLAKYKLSPAKFNALMVIKHHLSWKGITQIDICKKLIVTASNMTRLLDKLEKEKLIERFSYRNDRRVNLIKITKKGSDLLDHVWPGYCRRIEELAGVLQQHEQKTLSKLLLRWFSQVNK